MKMWGTSLQPVRFSASGCSFSQKLSGLTDADSFCLVLEALTGQVVQYSNKNEKKTTPKVGTHAKKAKCGEDNDRKRVKEEIAAAQIGK